MRASLRQWVLVLAAIFIVSVAAWRCFAPKGNLPIADALGYATLAINLTEHGVLSYRYHHDDAPVENERVGTGPLVIAELSLVVLADKGTRQTFECAVRRQQSKEECTVDLFGLRVIHFFEIVIFFAVLWLLARKVLGDDLKAALACLVALGFKEVFLFAPVALSETLFNAVAVSFLLAWLSAIDDAGTRWRWLVAGLLLGLVILVKPAFAALVLVAPVILAPFFFRARGGWRGLLTAWALLVAGYAATVGPFHIASFLAFGSFGLAEPIYLADSLAHRFGYNLMTLREWLMGWIYYLPDFGDTLANALFGVEATVRLGWSDSGLYQYGRSVLQPLFRQTAAEQSGAVRLFNELASQPITFVGVSLLLLWRGIFVSKYFGLAGVISLPFALWFMESKTRSRLIAIALPVFAMACVHAAISVSIPRYNLALIPVYACSLAWVLATLVPARWTRILEPPIARSSN